MGLCEILKINGSWGRIFSTYGPNDYEGYFIPYIIKSLKDGVIPQLSSCTQIWDYLFVKDAANAFLGLAESNCNGIYNIGSGTPIVLKEVVRLIQKVLKNEAPISYSSLPFKKGQLTHLEANISKLKSHTKWEQQINLEQGLQETVNFFG